MQGTERLIPLPAKRVQLSAQGAVVLAAAMLIALLAAPLASAWPALVLAGTLALTLAVSVWVHPPFGAYTLLVTTPLIVGVGRGEVIPLLRPSEAVLGVVAFAVLLRAAFELARGRARRVEFNRLDGAILAFAIFGSLVPLLWLVARGKEITGDDVFYGLQLWKYYAVFLVVRYTIRTEAQVRKCLWIIMLTGAVVALIGVLQALKLFGVPELLSSWYGQDIEETSAERGMSTFASSLAVGNAMVFSTAIATTMLLWGAKQRLLLLGLATTFVFGVIAAGQFSGYIAFMIAIVVVGLLTGSLGRYLAALVPAVVVGAVALWPVIARRLEGFQSDTGLPRGWTGRIENLETYFWPPLGDFNWILGVQPEGRVPAPETWREWVWIESGHTWLLWTGGVPFLIAFLVFMWVAFRRVATIARERVDAIGTAAVASTTSLVVIFVLMTFDAHITTRGEAELIFSLLALALTGTSESYWRARRRPHRRREAAVHAALGAER